MVIVEFDPPNDVGGESRTLVRRFVSVQVERGVMTGSDGVATHHLATWHPDGWEVEVFKAPHRFPTFRVWSGDFAAEIRAAVEQAERGREDPPAAD
jgi:hypothetical protein